jgi:MYXO-CTERM domain-containing protein
MIKQLPTILALGVAGHTLAAPMPIDLSTWTKEGSPGNGTWTVQDAGNSVFQSINGDPTFFVSPDDLSDTTIEGSFGVETTGDDDYIGFVFGYQSPLFAEGDPVNDYRMFLFDWKQGDQNDGLGFANEGFNLSYLSGEVTGFSPFWAHESATAPSANFEVIATDYGPDRGWADNTVYGFNLLYQSSKIEIRIDGGDFSNELIFSVTPDDVAGTDSFQAGRFGFYNYSQSSVRYQGFTEEDTPPDPPGEPMPAPAPLALIALGLIGLRLRR